MSILSVCHRLRGIEIIFIIKFLLTTTFRHSLVGSVLANWT